jgi:hypothetical protein
MAVGDFGLTHVSGLSIGIDPARTDLTPRSRGTGAVFSVGTNNIAGIHKISSGTFTLPSLTVAALASLVTTVTATGLDATTDYFGICSDSQLSEGLVITTYVSAANVGGLVLSSASDSAVVTGGNNVIRWVGINF